MLIEQIVDIPADHRLVLEVPLPLSLPQGKVRLALTVTPETPPHGAAMMSLLAMCGIDRGKDTLDAYFERKRSDKAREDGAGKSLNARLPVRWAFIVSSSF